MRATALTLILMVLPHAAIPDVKHGDITIDCYCTDTFGKRVELGESICLHVDGRSFVARCEMSLNNPTWRDTGERCTVSRLTPANTEWPA